MISENAATRLHLHANDRLRIETPTGARELIVRSIVVDFSSDVGMVFVDRRWFVEWWEDPLIDSIDIYLAPGEDVDGVAHIVKTRLGGADALFVSTAAELRREVRRIVLDTVAILRSTDLVAIIVAVFGVIGTMLAQVIDRVREIGLLRAIGATRRQVMFSIAAEAGFLGVAGALAGILASVPMGAIFVRVVALAATGWHLDYRYPALLAVEISSAIAATSLVAGLLPGRVAAQLPVSDALASE
jgi:putative ABC transport system permease protein